MIYTGERWNAIGFAVRDVMLGELLAERDQLRRAAGPPAEAPVVDTPALQGHLRDLEKTLASGDVRAKKQAIRLWVRKMKLAPELQQVSITYRLPEPVVVSVVAGARFGAIHERLEDLKVEVWPLPRKGRRNDLRRVAGNPV